MKLRLITLLAGITLAAMSMAYPAAQTQALRDFWNQEFRVGTGLVDKSPSVLLVEAVQERQPGAALDLGIGEGRNAVFLAGRGWSVTGVDVSDVALEQANENARAKGVAIATVMADLDVYDLGRAKWDLISSFYMHGWHNGSRTNVPRRVMDALKPGGLLVLEGFSDPPQQLGFKTADLAKAFRPLRILKNERVMERTNWYVREKTPLVRFIASKPS